MAASLSAGCGVGAAAQTAAQTAAPSETLPLRHFTVVLDAAHGGNDPGAWLGAGDSPSPETQSAMAEKAVTLAMSQRLRALLVARGFTVIETRQSDVALDEDARATVANHAQAGACIVLHATEAGSGVHLFVSSLSPAQPQLLLPWKTAQATRVAESLKLGGTLNSALSTAGRDGESSLAIPTTLGRTTLPGIDSMTCPAVAVEVAPLRENAHGGTGKVTSAVDDADYQTRVLNALAAALLAWRSEAAAP